MMSKNNVTVFLILSQFNEGIKGAMEHFLKGESNGSAPYNFKGDSDRRDRQTHLAHYSDTDRGTPYANNNHRPIGRLAVRGNTKRKPRSAGLQLQEQAYTVKLHRRTARSDTGYARMVGRS